MKIWQISIIYIYIYISYIHTQDENEENIFLSYVEYHTCFDTLVYGTCDVYKGMI